MTIPKHIRETLKLHTGDKIEITIVQNGEAVIRPILKKVADLFGKLHSAKRKGVSIEEMNATIKARAKHESIGYQYIGSFFDE